MIAELRRFLLYVAAGFAATATHYAVMMAAVAWAHTPEVVATCIGFVAGACVKYPLNYRAVFASREPHRVAVPRFVAALLFSFALNAAVFALLLHFLDSYYMVAQVLTTGAVLFVNYLLARCWIFRRRGGRDEEAA